MGALTDAEEDNYINHNFRGGAYTPPTTLYVGLLVAAPGEAGGGTEVSGGSYARVAVANASAEWAATVGGNGTTSNVNPITFPAPAADWGQVSHWAIWDSAVAGTMRYYAALGAAKNINNGDAAPVFPSSSLTFQIDN